VGVGGALAVVDAVADGVIVAVGDIDAVPLALAPAEIVAVGVALTVPARLVVIDPLSLLIAVTSSIVPDPVQLRVGDIDGVLDGVAVAEGVAALVADAVWGGDGVPLALPPTVSVAVGVADRLGVLEGLSEPDGVSVFVKDGVCVPVPDALALADGAAVTVALTSNDALSVALTSDDALAEGDDDSRATALADALSVALTSDDALAEGDDDSGATALAVCVSLAEAISVAVAEPRVGSGDGDVTVEKEEAGDSVAADVPVLVSERNGVIVAYDSAEAVSRTDADADASADAVPDADAVSDGVTDANAVADTAGEAVNVAAVEVEAIAVADNVARTEDGAVGDEDEAELPVPAAETVATPLADAVLVALEPVEDDGGGAEGADEKDAEPQSDGPGERLGGLLRDAVEVGGADAVAENVGGVVDMKII
jgi:hypothetical protein